MIYTELTYKAIKVAFKAHEGQLDKTGLPYILHPIHVAEQMKDEDSCVAAILHDVIEDTDITLEDLRKEGFTEKQLEAVALLTHDLSVDYMDYIIQLSGNPIARAVKIEDLKHNSDTTRALGNLTPQDIKRNQKYLSALNFLEGCN